MRSIFRMPSDELAGAAKAARADTITRRKAKCAAFLGCLPTNWQVPRKRRVRYHNQEEEIE